MRMITITLLPAGVSMANIRKEEFVITAPVVQVQPPDISTRQVKLVLNNEQHQFRSSYPNTILQAAKRAGVELPYSCETGRCGACAAECTSGNVWMKYNEVLTETGYYEGNGAYLYGLPGVWRCGIGF